MSDPGKDLDVLATRIEALACTSLGSAPCRIEWIEGQLGLRRFARVHRSGAVPETAIARIDAIEDPRGRPAGVPPEPPLEPIRALLEAQGLPVPRRYGADREIELLEDVGAVSLRDTVAKASPTAVETLYRQACDLVPALQRVADPGGVEAFRRHLDADLIAYKAELFIEWSLASRGRAASRAEAGVVRSAFARIAEACRQAPQRLAHRDLQSANLQVRGDAEAGTARLGIIDVQGAFLAPPEYDLVCLLRDSYVTLDPAAIEQHLARVLPRLPDSIDPDESRHRFDLLTLTRKGKDHARFLYAAHERGDDRFLPYLADTRASLRTAAHDAARRDPSWSPLSDLVHALPETPCGR